ncbi:hypothetical protein FOS14_05510 [Skermania sp. ID1734]|uniref:peptidase MA family metallohydrolase n=1 Tax=Skermania sp. ID1734 TaxID=2597516 RepID=UPI001180B3A4|nr:hypothetical protein [Skermania sp. ID1734]TSE01194.1 hypothetical protein FOS14_05510 [Skermania sp. ID1734]
MICLLVAVGLLDTACGSDATPNKPATTNPRPASDPYQQQRQAGVQRLLDQWAAALRSDDTTALARLVDPHAAPGFLDAQLRRANNLRGVPLSDWGFEISSEPDEPLPMDLADQLDATDVWAPAVYLHYGIAGPDAAPTRKPVSLTVARHGDTWLLVSEAPVGHRQTWHGPWDFGPLEAQKMATGGNRTAVVMGHPEQRAEIAALAADLPAAVASVTQLWGTGWSQAPLVITTGSADEFAQLAGAEHTGAEIAAVAVADSVDTKSKVVTGQRVVFSPDAATRLDAATRQSILRHELTHVAARSVTVDGSPMWMLEGFADYSGYRNSGLSFAQIAPRLTQEVLADGPPKALPADADYQTADDRAKLAYEQGWSACAYVAATFGEKKLVQLYHELARGPADAQQVDAAFRDVVGLDTAQFINRWGGWVLVQARRPS